MSFLRIGTVCVVLNDDGQVLLSRRGDTGAWALPGGRVDHHETLYAAALREVREETGADAEIIRPAGLYYMTRWKRMNVVFLTRAAGGTLHQSTRETMENRFFDPDALPDGLYHASHIYHALQDETVLKIVETSEETYNTLQRKFAMRWVKNLLSGNPEPRYPRFEINAVGLMWDPTHTGVLHAGDQLPRIECTGEDAPWSQLARFYLPGAQFRWVGVWQDTAQDIMEFVFSATVSEDSTVTHLEPGTGTRILLRELPFTGRDATFVRHAQPDKPQSVWMIDASS